MKGARFVYSIGDRVVYGIHGVCSLIGTEVKTVDRKKVEYYVLEPLDQPCARFYVPTQNLAAVAKMRRPLDRQALELLLDSPEVREDGWITDENQRKLHYRELIGSGDRAALLCMIRTLHLQKKRITESGRKFHLCDDIFLRDAQKLLNAEFSLVLEMPQEQVSGYIRQRLTETE
jgi:CarD family transcriptional regulator